MYRVVAVLVAALSFSLSNAQEVRNLKLKQQKLKYHPQHYYITNIVDDRADTSNIGTMRAGLANKTVQITLQNGVVSSLYNFIQKNLQQDETKAPIEVHITKMAVSEKTSGFTEQADLATAFAFYANGTRLIEYSGSAYAKTGMDASAYIEQLIRQNLESSLEAFDKWWGQNKDMVTGKPAVKVEVVIEDRVDDPDQVPYSKKLLTWDEFRGEADDLSLGAAATSSGLSIRMNSENKDGKNKVVVTITPFFDKTHSWVKPSGKNAAALTHEQMHFNITGLMACALASEILGTTYFVENFSQEIAKIHKRYIKELERRQNEYDKETAHGTIAERQRAWEQQLNNELSNATCYQ